ncbi:MAG: protein kinase, partial [Pyrinomonadaceae bacterium]
MTPERWQKIEEIFHEALELADFERSTYLAERTGDDDELRSEVEKLLSQFDDASSFIEQPLYDSARTGFLSDLLDDSDDDPMVGKVLGSYRIEREIGRGGMGAVYEAVRADGEFRLRVALKVVKRGVDTDFVLRRFRNERQILAALDHPFITRLIDGGSTDDGRPYFVMDYIDGFPLYRYCDKNRLGINERLRLFCRLAEAVGYAHQKLVIHRDLKPSNIFITIDGSPRLLDFGIAKLLDPDLAIDTLQPTATALRMMTVDYASPEQVRGEKVTFATDIYSLGVVLFELLTGFRPYRIESRSPHEVARAICDDDPITPSEAIDSRDSARAVPVNQAATTLMGVADLRSRSPEDLREQLRGNLDNIVLKALQKKPEDRYQSVVALTDDIQRHLKGEAVSFPEFTTHRSSTASQPMSSDGKLVAVLPLSLMNPTGAESTDETYLTIGLADAIITRLASVSKLTVRPTSSITRYNEHLINPFRAGRELGVDFVLDGRIRRFGERLRISLQLLDVYNGLAIWAGQFDEHLTDVLALEDAISEQVAAALIPRLTGEDREKLAKRGTSNAAAYEAYLRGRFFWNQFTSQSLPKALAAYQSAIELDPDYALAYSAIAEVNVWAGIYGLIPTQAAYENAEPAIRRALA